MGIPRLTKILRPYALSGPLEYQVVVIDGPALSFHIYHLCLSSRREIARNQLETGITHKELGDVAIQFLDSLRDHRVFVREIYFDGWLPPSKYDTRSERLIRQTKQLKSYHAGFPITPCCSSSPSLSHRAPHNLFASPIVPERLAKLPPVPFLVPAILESLLGSEYSNVTKVVPGEADEYCAASLKEKGGIALTGDSDLLVHDIGEASIVFFKDIEKDSGALKCLVYCPADIAARLELPAPNGLLLFAFELKVDVHASFPELLIRARTSESIKNRSEELEEFRKEYAYRPGQGGSDDGRSSKILRSLDPRVSEYVLQTPLFAELAGHTPNGSMGLTPHIFLPFLFGSPIRTSPWEMSQTVRQLAYGLLNLVLPQGQVVSSVYEYRRQETKSNGRELQLPVDSVPAACQTLLTFLQKVSSKLPELPDSQFWIAVSVCEEIEWSYQHSKPALGPLVRHQEILVQDKTHKNLSWDILQFFAQIQSTHYSFRILKLMIALVATRSDNPLPQPVLQLKEKLDSFPLLADFPEIDQTLPIIKMIRDKDIGRVAHEILGIEVPQIPATPQVSRREAKRKRKAGGDLSKGGNRSNNPFALLDAD
ncbi:hypothetical protein HYALB_00003938 [Hymenoscyphus albidus]|uniref:Asteroid domain-containing protein n=1 Tax=Hymenoscyphus albidus TaxID=595503 RepID=A0A9N9LU89_9HELO|nr:hypothetical protein HYALB_00003938 [Hymenoscyphus albidus]